MKKWRKKILAGSLVLAVLFSLLSLSSKAEENESVLKSADVKSTGCIQGKDGFCFDGTDIQRLADDMDMLYKSCQ